MTQTMPHGLGETLIDLKVIPALLRPFAPRQTGDSERDGLEMIAFEAVWDRFVEIARHHAPAGQKAKVNRENFAQFVPKSMGGSLGIKKGGRGFDFMK